MNENPYQPSTTTVIQISVPPTRKFRWGIIPPTFFWLYLPAVVMVSGGCVILTLRSWRRFAELWAAGERAIPLLASTPAAQCLCRDRYLLLRERMDEGPLGAERSS